MMTSFAKQLLATTLSVLLLIGTVPLQVAAQSPQPGYSGQGVPLTAEEIQPLVAPIALYPDALVAQVLAAATFPDQVAAAESWIQYHSYMTGSTLMAAVDQQPWDPAIKALSQFPSVLANMAANLTWTSSLGEAYHLQAADMMAAIQVLRAKAYAAGNLKSSTQLAVVQQSPQVIVIQPVNPQVVYVPMYNPAVVYGYPYVVPAYVPPPPPPAGAAVVAFGVGIAVGAMMAGSSYAWGYSSWNCGWHGSTTVVYHGGAYYGNNAWRGGYYGSSGSVYGPNGAAHYSSGYNPSSGTYARGGTVSNGYGSQSVGQAYNPRTGTYAATEQGSNASGSWGSSTVSKNGNTAYSQHQTTSQGTTGSVQTTNGGSAYGASGKYNSGAVGQTANGNKYASVNGTQYKNTGSGVQSDKGGSWNNVQKPSSSSSGWGQQEKSGGSSAFGGSGSGWENKTASARGLVLPP